MLNHTFGWLMADTWDVANQTAKSLLLGFKLLQWRSEALS
jgi:hypothetical protein